MKKVLVAGGAGFIGTHLCKKLLEKNLFVYCLDNLSSGSINNIKPLFNDSSFSFLKHDVTIPIKLDVDEIYNLACPASPAFYQEIPIMTAKSSVIGTLNLLELAKNTKAKLIQASTSEIYGNALKYPQNEQYFGNVNPVGLRSCYDEGKRMAETLCMDFFRKGITVKIARIFNTYGPGMRADDGRVVPSFITKALENKPLIINGDGNQTRSFMYIDDLIDGLMTLIESDGSLVGPINLGNPEEVSIQTLASLIIELTSSKSTISYSKALADDPKKRKPDITQAIKQLSWKPHVGLLDGLRMTIPYYQHFSNE